MLKLPNWLVILLLSVVISLVWLMLFDITKLGLILFSLSWLYIFVFSEVLTSKKLPSIFIRFKIDLSIWKIFKTVISVAILILLLMEIYPGFSKLGLLSKFALESNVLSIFLVTTLLWIHYIFIPYTLITLVNLLLGKYKMNLSEKFILAIFVGIFTKAYLVFLFKVILKFSDWHVAIVFLDAFVILAYMIQSLRRISWKNGPPTELKVTLFDIMALMLALIFWGTSMWLTRDAVYMPTNDLVRHYGFSKVISIYSSPIVNYGSEFFYFAYAFAIKILGENPGVFLFSQNTLNLLIPIVLYLFAKYYLKRIIKAPALTLLLSYMGGGLAWLYIFEKTTYLPKGNNLYQLLTEAYNRTFSMTMYSTLFYYIGFLPIAVGYLGLLSIFILCRINDETPNARIHLFSLSLILACILGSHRVEAYLASIILALFAVISNNKENFKIYLYSTTIATIIIIPITFTSSNVYMGLLGVIMAISLPFVYCIIVSFILIIKKLSKLISLKFSRKSLYHASLGFAVVYLALMIPWRLEINTFEVTQVAPFYIVPMYHYPAILGIKGLLALLSLPMLYSRMDKHGCKHIHSLLYFGIIVFLLGKFTSFVNVQLFYVYYWEIRFVTVLSVVLSFLASIYLAGRNWDAFYEKLVVLFIGFTLVASLILNISTWSYFTSNPSLKVSEDELRDLIALSGLLQSSYNNIHLLVITPPTFTNFIVDYLAPFNKPVTANYLLFDEQSYVATLGILNALFENFQSENRVAWVVFDRKFDISYLESNVPLINFMREDDVIYEGKTLIVYELPSVKELTQQHIEEIREEIPIGYPISALTNNTTPGQYNTVTKSISVFGNITLIGAFSKIKCDKIIFDGSSYKFIEIIAGEPVTINSEGGKIFVQGSVKKIELHDQDKKLVLNGCNCSLEVFSVEHPSMNIVGSTKFNGLLTNVPKIRDVTLPDLSTLVIIRGLVNFSITNAGKYIYLDLFNLEGEIAREPPKIKFDYSKELESLTLIACIFLVIVILFLYLSRRFTRPEGNSFHSLVFYFIKVIRCGLVKLLVITE